MPDFLGAKRKLERGTRGYYLLSTRLREHPPSEEPFTLRQLCEQFDLPIWTIREAVYEYRNDSLLQLKYTTTPAKLTEEQSFNWALDLLHEDGFYLVTPLTPLNRLWGEPTFRQMEDNNLRLLIEGMHRIRHRLGDALDFRFEVDGLDLHNEFESIVRKQLALEDFARRQAPPSQ